MRSGTTRRPKPCRRGVHRSGSGGEGINSRRADRTADRTAAAGCSQPNAIRGLSLSAVIHIVDDDASFRKAMARMLRIAGYVVESYEDARQLLNSLPDGAEPSCIL